ncbi:MAG: PEGA domain-containing protein [Deltaproteobacteria bacterium]|nr:PEGA domain-containing protein [Deltaproteobacteria bacterium]
MFLDFSLFFAQRLQGDYRTSGTVKEIKLYSGYHALVVGCSDYRSGWPRLPNPVKDAKEVASMLKRLGWYVDILEDPDGKLLKRELNKLVTGPGKNREKGILVWFSGHGQTIEEADGTKLGYLVPVDAPDPDKDLLGFMERAVSMRQIETVSKQIRSKHVLMAFDSCFSGAIFQMVRSKPSAFIEEKVAYPVREFITAGTEDEQVPDKSVFKDVFIQGIRDGFADLNRDNYITGEELGAYIQEKVINYSRKAQHPQFGKINNPKLDKGDFVFLVASSGAVIENPIPEATKAYLSMRSNVSGARVLVDGQYVGTTNLSNVEIPSGEHRIGVVKDGFESYSKQIVFEKGRTRDLYVILDRKTPLTGRLYVNTEPDNARVRILNIGPAFDQGMALDSGSYHVEVSANGYDTKKLWVTLGAGEDKDLDIRLKKSADTAVSFSSSSGYTGTRIIGRHDQFIAHANGVIYDKNTNLEWIVGPDRDTDWYDAKKWVGNLRVAGGGWKMPSRKELRTLYKPGAGAYNMTHLLKTTGLWVWSGETRDSSSAWGFGFSVGYEYWEKREASIGARAFAFRFRK